jgi:hypothetical protein
MEKKIEDRFRREVVALGCRVIKFEDGETRGKPDRLVLIPGGIAMWVEFKQPGEVPRYEQVKYMEELNRLGFVAVWADAVAEVVDFIRAVIRSPAPLEIIKIAIEAQRNFNKRAV